MFGNKKGPMNEGPMTGRGLGYCSGNDKPGCSFEQTGRGIKSGRNCKRGKGFGREYFYRNDFSKDFQDNSSNEKEILKARKEFLEKELEALNTKLND